MSNDLDTAAAPSGAGGQVRSDLAGAVERLSGTRVLVLGDIMLDRFVYGAVDRTDASTDGINPTAVVAMLPIAV